MRYMIAVDSGGTKSETVLFPKLIIRGSEVFPTAPISTLDLSSRTSSTAW